MAPDIRDDAYLGERPEVQALVPAGARRVLDLGCAGGAIGAGLKRRHPGIEVVGVELDPAYAAAASERLDRVVEGDVETAIASADLGRFDCIVAADVLEHLADPWTAVTAAAQLLDPGGTLVASLPNVRFWETFWQLGVRGAWPRRPSGIFDATHLRWFTLKDARDLLEQSAGLEIVSIHRKIWILPRASRLDRPFAWLARTPLAPFFTAQHLLVARKPG